MRLGFLHPVLIANLESDPDGAVTLTRDMRRPRRRQLLGIAEPQQVRQWVPPALTPKTGQPTTTGRPAKPDASETSRRLSRRNYPILRAETRSTIPALSRSQRSILNPWA